MLVIIFIDLRMVKPERQIKEDSPRKYLSKSLLLNHSLIREHKNVSYEKLRELPEEIFLLVSDKNVAKGDLIGFIKG
jgi:hypothetical protein